MEYSLHAPSLPGATNLKNGDIDLMWLGQSHAVYLDKVEFGKLSTLCGLSQRSRDLVYRRRLARARDARDVHTPNGV